jgi:hypothetical protein
MEGRYVFEIMKTVNASVHARFGVFRAMKIEVEFCQVVMQCSIVVGTNVSLHPEDGGGMDL